MGQGGWAAATLLKRGTEELSKPWQTLGNEGKFESEGEQEGDVTLWENIWTKEGGEDRTFFFCFLSLLAWDFEVDRRQERKRCLPTACHASAGTPLQAKTKRVRLTMFMFSLLAKVDFNRNTVSTINTPPPLCPIPYSCSAPLYRPEGFFERQQWPSLLSCCVNIWEELMNKRMIGQTASVSAKAQTPLPPAFSCAKRWNKKRRAKDNERAWEEIALLQL